jgi:hypothetical protein
MELVSYTFFAFPDWRSRAFDLGGVPWVSHGGRSFEPSGVVGYREAFLESTMLGAVTVVLEGTFGGRVDPKGLRPVRPYRGSGLSDPRTMADRGPDPDCPTCGGLGRVGVRYGYPGSLCRVCPACVEYLDEGSGI